MNFNEIEKLIDHVSSSPLSYFEVESEGLKLIMKKELSEAMIKDPVRSYVKEEIVRVPEVSVETEVSSSTDYIVKSPIVGTVYLSSSPAEKDYVEVGRKVKKGEVLCIIEAMKLMNEIEAEIDGTITSVMVKNEEIVEYGMPLFLIKPELGE
jgi:acetyl-CoA carboxylase biotin carboxyl carrier protein